MAVKKQKKPTYKELEQKLVEAQAYDIMRLMISHDAVAKLNGDRYMGSGLIVTITNLSGKMLVEPTMIADGFSSETQVALRADIKRTHAMRLSLGVIRDAKL